MAIYHCRFKVHSRGSGAKAAQASAYRSGSKVTGRTTSAVRSAAYRSGGILTDAADGEVHDFTKKHGVVWNGILAPDDAPAWATQRNALWNQVEKAEKRKDAQLFREAELSIPRELDPTQRIALVRSFVQDQFVAKGMVADIGIHCPTATDGDEQPHAHVMLTMRSIGPEGFGAKNRAWNDRAMLKGWREQWEVYCNAALEDAGSRARVDHRSLADQGAKREPLPNLGVAVHVKELSGGCAVRRDEWDRINYDNKLRQAVQQVARSNRPRTLPSAPPPTPTGDPFEDGLRQASWAIARDLMHADKRAAMDEAGRVALAAARRLRFYAKGEQVPDPETLWGPSHDR